MEEPPQQPLRPTPELDEPQPSLFPLFSVTNASSSSCSIPTNSTSAPQWLCNSSFTTDISVINDTVSSHFDQIESEKQGKEEEEDDDDEEQEEQHPRQPPSSYDILESSESDIELKRDKEQKKRRKHKKKRKRREYGEDRKPRGGFDSFGHRKSGVRTWADSDTATHITKDYYFDTHGDPDNVTFGSIYRMDIARYKPSGFSESSGIDFQSAYWRNLRGSLLFDRDGDVDALDGKLKSDGRYWSAKYTALERHKSLKRIHLLIPKKITLVDSDEFIPFLDAHASSGSGEKDSASRSLVVEESWEDEMLRKTREFNRLTREHPHDEKVWLDFAEFQDKVAGMQPQKGARLQTLEKKISILEKAVELNPDSEDLLLCLLRAYQRRDSTDVLIGRWEKILLHHSGNCRLWREFLHFVQGDFSRFKVSEMRKMYMHAIQALSGSCSKRSRQKNQMDPSPVDPEIVHQEIGLVDIFVSLCKFEWQAGFQELTTALFQAEIEYSLFSPSLLLTEQNKQRLFEHFWNSDGARIGEEGALGWSTWLEKEEESRQRSLKEEMSDDDEQGGWTGWSDPKNRDMEIDNNSEPKGTVDSTAMSFQEKDDNQDNEQEDDTEMLLKILGVDMDSGANVEVNDVSTWNRWSLEESSRDSRQWMPVRKTSVGSSLNGETSEMEDKEDDQLLRMVLYDDVNEFLFSLSSTEARLFLVSQFIDFYGGKISPLVCTNNTSLTEQMLSLEALPDYMLQKLRRIHDTVAEGDTCTGFTVEYLISSIPRTADMMKFLRNVILLSLTVFPRNHILEEALLIAEEFFVSRTKDSSHIITPCRTLAKSLLKSDRQDILLCGIYAKREAHYGNIEHARRIFDMALSSLEALPVELQSCAPLLYFWYAETELANVSGGHESSSRAIHVLSCFGSGVKYSPFKIQTSNLQLLRARQGFKEKVRTLRSTWVRGVIDDQSLALMCAAALFEGLTSGMASGIEVLDQAFAMVLPERRSRSHHLEFLFHYYIKMLQIEKQSPNLSKIWETICQGLQIYPFSLELYDALLEVGHLHTTSNKLRWILDDYFHKKPSLVVWLFAMSYDLSKGSSKSRIRGLFERAVADDKLHSSVVVWRCYIAFEINIACDPSAARRIFFRAIHACPWSKRLWLDGFLKLNSTLTAKELSDLQEVMREKELNLRTDIYEILLQEDLAS